MPLVRYLQNKLRDIGFSRNLLAIIAMFSMLIDHTALTLIQNGKLYGYDAALYRNAISLPEAKRWIMLYTIMRMIGRIAFPIFCLLLVEGFRKTSNLFKYFVRLFILAIISEIPYDLMVFNEILTPTTFQVQNVIFTYLIGLLMLLVIRMIHMFPSFLTIFPVIGAGFATHFLKTDYALEGIILIYVFYILRHDINVKCLLGLIITFTMSLEHYHGAAIISMFFIYFYDGQKGYLDLKRFSYIFYPLHMLILYGIVYFSNFGNR